MMQHEFEALVGEAVSVEVFDLMQAVYNNDALVPVGGHDGHETVARWYKRNKLAVASMAAVVHASKVEAADAHRQRADAVEEGKAQLRQADRRNRELQAAVDEQHARATLAELLTSDVQRQLDETRTRWHEARAEAAEARGKLLTLAQAAAIMDDLKAAVVR